MTEMTGKRNLVLGGNSGYADAGVQHQTETDNPCALS